MMLIGARVAVVPVGISCQTAFQIDLRKPKLELAIGEPLAQMRGPFDLRLVGPADIAAMLRENNPYPPTPAELSGDRRRYWAARKCWFWHDKWDDFGRFTEKQAHLWANWGRIGRAARQVFITSDTQNNVARTLKQHGTPIPVAPPAALVTLQCQLDQLFTAPELHLITRNRTLPPVIAAGARSITVHQIAKDRSQWQGDGTAWGRILDRIIRHQAQHQVEA